MALDRPTITLTAAAIPRNRGCTQSRDPVESTLSWASPVLRGHGLDPSSTGSWILCNSTQVCQCKSSQHALFWYWSLRPPRYVFTSHQVGGS